MADTDASNNQRIRQVVLAIPAGQVATYGTIAEKAGLGRAARRVGHALHKLPADTRIPWHRVVNAQGHLSLPKNSDAHATQRERLKLEGIEFSVNDKIDLRRYGW